MDGELSPCLIIRGNILLHRGNLSAKAHPGSVGKQALREAINDVRQRHPFSIDAWVLLPEHLHCIWTLPEGCSGFSLRWSLIKSGFSKRTKVLFHVTEWINDSRRHHRESTIWQRRFREHLIRDEDEYRACMDYIHYNPVKHGHVRRVIEWPYSTFHRYVQLGIYPEHWGGGSISDEQGHPWGE